jgi:hypothetical protein
MADREEGGHEVRGSLNRSPVLRGNRSAPTSTFEGGPPATGGLPIDWASAAGSRLAGSIATV